MHRSTTTTNPIDVDWSQIHRHGAEEARGAHNSEVTGSKPVAGIYLHIAMVHQGTGATCIRYGAEEARGVMAAAGEPEVVRSKLTAGLFQFASFTEAGRHSSSDVKHEPFTGVAQRKRAGLIIPRT